MKITYTNFEDIKHAVDSGIQVFWENDNYTVIKDLLNCYLIAYCIGTVNVNYVGLHEPSYNPMEFYHYE